MEDCCFTHTSSICKKIYIHVYVLKWEITHDSETKIQFPVMEADWKLLLSNICSWFILNFAKQSKSPILTNIHSILNPLDDVKGVLHIAPQNVKLHIISAIGKGSKQWHCGSQEHNFCWKITIRHILKPKPSQSDRDCDWHVAPVPTLAFLFILAR